MKYLDVRNLARKMRAKQTHSERILWSRLKDRQLDGFRFLRQYPILYDRNRNDLIFFIADFYCAKARLVIEIDGKIHLDRIDYDLWRQHIIEKLNITVLRLRNEELEKMEEVIEKIKRHLKK